MSLVVVFDEGASPQKVLEVHASANTPDWDFRSDVLVNPDLSLVLGVPERYWKVVGSEVQEFAQGEKDAQDAAEAAAADAALRAGGKGLFDGQTAEGQAFRAFIQGVVGQINTLRAFHSLPDITLAQVKSAIQASIDAGDVDE